MLSWPRGNDLKTRYTLLSRQFGAADASLDAKRAALGKRAAVLHAGPRALARIRNIVLAEIDIGDLPEELHILDSSRVSNHLI